MNVSTEVKLGAVLLCCAAIVTVLFVVLYDRCFVYYDWPHDGQNPVLAGAAHQRRSFIATLPELNTILIDDDARSSDVGGARSVGRDSASSSASTAPLDGLQPLPAADNGAGIGSSLQPLASDTGAGAG